MIQRTNLKVAYSHLTSRFKQALVAALSVTFGISMYVFMNGFMSGVNDTQTAMAFSTLAHVRIYNDLPEDRTNLLARHYPDMDQEVYLRNPHVIQYTEGIRNVDQVMHDIAHVPQIEAMTAHVSMNVFFRNGATKISGALAGVTAAEEEALFGMAASVVEGSWYSLDQQKDAVVMGIGLAKRLGLNLHDRVVVSTADGVSRNLEITGLLETTLTSLDNGKAYIAINGARQLLGENRSYATEIQVNVRDFNQAEEAAKLLAPLVDYEVESWLVANGQLDAANELRNIIALAVSFTILLVAGFGIYNIMNMTVNEKIKEIAILKAMGFEGNDIVQIFLVQSLIIGMIGGVIGLLFGSGVSFAISQIPFEMASLDTLPMSFRSSDYLSAFGFGLLTTFIAGFLPAKKASKVDPVAIIRG